MNHSAIVAAGGVLVGELAAATVFESGEAILGIIKAGKASATKKETEYFQANVRLSDVKIEQSVSITAPQQLAYLESAHQNEIYRASPTARFLHDVLKMPLTVIAALVDAHHDDEHDDEHDNIGRKLIEVQLNKE